MVRCDLKFSSIQPKTDSSKFIWLRCFFGAAMAAAAPSVFAPAAGAAGHAALWTLVSGDPAAVANYEVAAAARRIGCTPRGFASLLHICATQPSKLQSRLHKSSLILPAQLAARMDTRWFESELVSQSDWKCMSRADRQWAREIGREGELVGASTQLV